MAPETPWANQAETCSETEDMMRDHLQAYCSIAFPTWQEVKVSDLSQISTGWESVVYAFDAEYGPPKERQCEELILRIYPGEDAWDKSAHEFRGMRQLHEVGYPVPRVLILERENSPFDKPFVIMERIAGEMLWPLLFNAPEGGNQELLTLFCRLFVELHSLEWGRFINDGTFPDVENPYAFIDYELSGGRAFFVHFPMTGFLPLFEWLEQRRDQVPCHRPSLIHWDFHPGNILLCEDKSAVVIDWTQLSISDYRFDLAWTLLLIGAYEGMEWRDIILREYERLAGVRTEQLEYFDVFACAKRLLSIAVSLSEGPEKLGMRPDAVAKIRQQLGATEQVYNLLLERTGVRIPEIERLFHSA
jgi:aminoglycoside phosphotransferase (APT) family kinase protein